jgi:hypothetical protein
MSENVISVDFSKGRSTTKPKMPAQAAAVKVSMDDAVKLMVFTLMIAESKVQVRLATEVEGVVIPESLRGEVVQVLNFSKKFGVPDFNYDHRGVRASLSFNGVDSLCDIPWPAVFAMACEKTGAVCAWPNAMIPEP